MLVPWLFVRRAGRRGAAAPFKALAFAQKHGGNLRPARDRLSCDTNTLLSLSSRDRHARAWQRAQ